LNQFISQNQARFPFQVSKNVLFIVTLDCIAFPVADSLPGGDDFRSLVDSSLLELLSLFLTYSGAVPPAVFALLAS
jgi:hypothetical protein